MQLYLDTSNFTALLKLFDEKAGQEYQYTAELGREMAEQLLSFIEEKLQAHNKTWQDLTRLTYFSGPGSFTGLRIGAAVINALAHELKLPLFDHRGTQYTIILPDYGRPARISAPKK